MDDGLYTVKSSDKPISGKVYGYFGVGVILKKVYTNLFRPGNMS